MVHYRHHIRVRRLGDFLQRLGQTALLTLRPHHGRLEQDLGMLPFWTHTNVAFELIIHLACYKSHGLRLSRSLLTAFNLEALIIMEQDHRSIAHICHRRYRRRQVRRLASFQNFLSKSARNFYQALWPSADLVKDEAQLLFDLLNARTPGWQQVKNLGSHGECV